MTNHDKKIISLPQNILFHFPSKHKDKLLEFRLWIIAKNFLDLNGVGFCGKTELIKFAKIKPATLAKLLRHSKLFRGYSKKNIYYFSQFKVARTHHLRFKTKFRLEYLSKAFVSRFRNQQKFKAYIIKCYFENDLRKKCPKYTNGRISNNNAAEAFNLSNRTVQRLTKISKAVKKPNIKVFKNIKVDIKSKSKSKFGNWLLNHAEERIDGYTVGNNFSSYFVRVDKHGKYYLCQQLPNIFRFTGVRLKAGVIRGNVPTSSKLMHKTPAPKRTSKKEHRMTPLIMHNIRLPSLSFI